MRSKQEKLDYMKQYYLKNKVRILEYQKQYEILNKDKINTYQLNYRQLHPKRSSKYLYENPYKKQYYLNRKIKFNGKSITVNKQLRSGVCVKCQKSVKNGDIKITNLHHLKYDILFPAENTIELCVGCHRRAHKKIRESV